MKRRKFIAALGAAAAWPLAANGQTPARLVHVVLLSPVEPSLVSLRKNLQDLGYVEGRNIRLDVRSAGGQIDRLPGLAEAVVREGGIDAILAQSFPAAIAACTATQTIPIVATVGIDPVASGLADSLAHPGHNVTGIAIFAEEMDTKLVELLREIAPRAVRLAAVAAITGGGNLSLGAIQEAGRKLDFDVEIIKIADPADLATALSPEVLTRFDAFMFPPDVVLSSYKAEVLKLIGLSNKPAVFPSSDWAESGGLLSFGPDLAEVGRHSIFQLDRVLKGEKPGDLPFERPTKFTLIINLHTARAMGIELPPTLLVRAEKVID
ncbi:ABC transporter substrate-binding protein [Bradyrhizobium jicamae]|uniref:ABC transporter substrate-binding protein n=1 Tax=Bradyrhizobium jicamae TaxID=280332 RepID=A0ABS5FYF8_9BRAD|nr:ABC transporter substrate-binding protein [Bradyrhizobium jicamae]MBR0801845.1 ABC transporter substrate-binding protein [Bradyrhizobium jicamae]